jgi:hypothetical protein
MQATFRGVKAAIFSDNPECGVYNAAGIRPFFLLTYWVT